MVKKYLIINRNIILFFLAICLNGLIWLYLVPIWHTPDEQAHFGQVAFMAEKRRIPDGKDQYDLTEEIYVSEQFLGTARDKLGNNQFTFHPKYRIEYTNTLYGKYESRITSLAKTDAKRKFVHSESSRYPALYYIPATWLYRLFYDQTILIKVFIIRLWSLLLYVATVCFVFKLGKLIFIKDKLSYFTLTILVAFQPMFIFSNIGVNSDSLGNLLFTMFIYLSTKIMVNLKYKDLLFITIVAAIATYAKPQFIVIFPILFILFLLIIIKNKKILNNGLVLIITILVMGLILLFINLLQWPRNMLNYFANNLHIPALIRYSLEYTLPHTIKEVLPWYWGIYDWLGVTYPRLVHRIINRMVILAFIGLLLSLVQVLKSKLWKKPIYQIILFQSAGLLLYFIAISFFDYLSWYTSKYSLGVQGRYFFPYISIEMLLLLLGIRSLFPNFLNLKIIMVKILALSMICLNLYAYFLVTSTYYDTSSINSFIIQVSQYKPWFIKGGYIETTLLIYTIVLFIGVVYPLIVSNNKNDNHS